MKTITRVALAGVAAVAISVPAIALAAKPVKGGTYSNQKLLGEFVNVSKTGKTARVQVSPGTCNSGRPVRSLAPAKIAKGKLTYNGLAAAFGFTGPAHLTAHGKFVTRKSLKLTVKVTVGACTASHSETLKLAKS